MFDHTTKNGSGQGFSTSVASRVASMSIGQLRSRLAEIKALEATLAAEKIQIVTRMDQMARDEKPTFVVPEHELVAHAGMSSREARTVVARSVVVDEAPLFGDLLANGATTAAHVDALKMGLRLTGADHDAFLAHVPELAQAAQSMPIGEFSALVRTTVHDVTSDDGLSRFERQQRATHLKIWDDAEGMVHLRGAFDPVSGAAIRGAIKRQVEAMFHAGDPDPIQVAPWIEPNDHRQAKALVRLATPTKPSSTSGSDGDTTREPRAEVVVHIDLTTLQNGLHARSTCRTEFGQDLAPETVRRLACDAEIIPMVLDGRSVPIDVGRSKRLATVHQRRALEATYETCAIPECSVPYHHCQIHHIEYWESGGSTDLSNMVPLCSKHHHAAHEGGWMLRLDPATRELAVKYPESLISRNLAPV
jgi:hypothetical protein